MMTQLIRRAFIAAAALVCAASLACSFSHSSGSSSDSSKSSSGSSGSSGDDTKAFRNDVSQYTEAFIEAGGGQQQTFFSGLSDLARKRGVSDWESEPSTWEAIGSGIRRTKATDAQRTAYETAWAGGDAERESAMARGFASAR
jgi:hypothetical protein